MPVPTISAQQLQQFNQERSNAAQGLLTSQAQNIYQRELADLQYKNNLGKFNIDWGRRRENLPRTFIDRGIFDSGIYQRALKDYATDRLSGLNDLSVQHQLASQGMAIEGRSAEDDYARSMYGSYNREYATKADIAAALRGVM